MVSKSSSVKFIMQQSSGDDLARKLHAIRQKWLPGEDAKLTLRAIHSYETFKSGVRPASTLQLMVNSELANEKATELTLDDELIICLERQVKLDQ